MKSLVVAGAILLLALASPARAQMPPEEFFLKIGGVAGDVHDLRHAGWLRLLFADPMCVNPEERLQGLFYCLKSGGVEFRLTRHAESFSAQFAEAFRTGRHFATVSVETYHDFGGGDFEADGYALSDATIVRYAPASGHPATEDIVIVCTAMTPIGGSSETALFGAH